MQHSLFLPAGASLTVLVVGLALLSLGALMQSIGMVNAMAPGARALLRGLLILVGVLLLGWGAWSYAAARHPSAPPPPAVVAPPPPTAPSDLVQAATAAIATCPAATEPTVPDSAHATVEQMVEAGKAFKSYDTAVVAYTHCVDAAADRLAQQYGAAAGDAEVQRMREFTNTAHNTAIDQEQSLADRFNTQVRAFKERHPAH
jgi:hypothetical protein